MYRRIALHALLPSQLLPSQLLPARWRPSWGPFGKGAQEGYGGPSREADHEEDPLARLNLYAPPRPRQGYREEPELPAGAASKLPDGPLTPTSYREERERVEREIATLRVLIRQSERELEAQQQRQAAALRMVEQVEERLEQHSREEMRAVYIQASEAEMRAFMVAEQLDQSKTKLEAFERYDRFLTNAIGALATSEPATAGGVEAAVATASWADEDATAPQTSESPLAGDDLMLGRLEDVWSDGGHASGEPRLTDGQLDEDDQHTWLWSQPTTLLLPPYVAPIQELPATGATALYVAGSVARDASGPLDVITEVAEPSGADAREILEAAPAGAAVEAPKATPGGADAPSPDEELAVHAQTADEPGTPAVERGIVVMGSHATAVGHREADDVRGLTREALQRVVRAQEEVAERAARQIQSGTMQSLMSLALDVGMYEQMAQADPATALDGLEHVRTLVNGMLHEQAQSMLDFQPLRPGERSFVTAVRRYATMISSQCRIPFELVAPHGEVALPAEAATVVLRVAQEALRNAARHSHASLILVLVDFLPDRLSLTVEDDGVGFDARGVPALEYARGAGGLIGMLERAELLGGWLRVESGLGKGCLVELNIPLEREMIRVSPVA